MGAERERVRGFGKLEDGLRQAGDWYLWGPYVSERQWGTVREDYSADGEAWDYLPHDHARSRAYRWGEDGLAGFCDVEQRLCLGLALWNGRDPILKERAFGLTGAAGQPRRGRQGVLVVPRRRAQPRLEPVALPLPAGGVPVRGPASTRTAAGASYEPEYELLDTGAFDDDRYWIIEVHYAKADPDDLLMSIQVTNAGPGRRHPARAAHRLVPQHLVLGRRRARGPGWRRPAAASVAVRPPVPGRAGAARPRPGPDGAAPDAAVLRERDQHRAAVRRPRRSRRTPRTASTTTSSTGAPTVNPGPARHQVRVLVPG